MMNDGENRGDITKSRLVPLWGSGLGATEDDAESKRGLLPKGKTTLRLALAWNPGSELLA